MKLLIYIIGLSLILTYGDELKSQDINAKEYGSNLISQQKSGYLDDYFQNYMETNHVPGLSACIIKFNDFAWTGSYGYAKIDQGIEVTDSTLFQIASISKILSGTALMQLYDSGLFELDDNINDYLPFQVSNPNHPDSAISFFMLLTHTSSIRDNMGIMNSTIVEGGDSPIPLMEFLEGYFVPGGTYYSTNNYYGYVPGSNWIYTSMDMSLIAGLTESISGTPFAQYCNENIYSPLEMGGTSWFLADLDTNNIAMPYKYSNGNYIPQGYLGYAGYPAVQLRTSITDLGLFLNTIIQGGESGGVQILENSTVDMMTTIHFPTTYPGLDQGFVWFNESINGKSCWGHIGDMNGIRSTMYFCPAENTGVIILANGETNDYLYPPLGELFQYAADSIITSIEDKSLNGSIRLHPNPFQNQTQIKYSIPKNCKVEIDIFNINGSLIRRLINKEQAEGDYSINWDGTNTSGNEVAPGIYLCRANIDKRFFIKKTIKY
jgi:CubicO group peptidase (beta-lactamase class C family)